MTNCGGNVANNAIFFHTCTNLTNCTGSGNATDSCTGFSGCTNLTNCTGGGKGSGYAFYNCRIMSMNSIASGSSGAYSGCYMHASGTDDPVGDTAAGGWNRS